jgi:hypothetical protein
MQRVGAGAQKGSLQSLVPDFVQEGSGFSTQSKFLPSALPVPTLSPLLSEGGWILSIYRTKVTGKPF